MKQLTMFIFLIFTLSLLGCESMGDKTKKGAILGGVVGAAAGGIIGHQSGHGWQGALIGAGAGAVGGGLIGNTMDKKATEMNPNHISLTKVAEMAKSGVPDSVIIDDLKNSQSIYELDAEMIGYLKDNNVGDRVLDYMLSTVHKG